MNKFLFLTFLCVQFSFSQQPNVVVLLADDMGFGEVQALNPRYGKIPTPNLDRVAAEGLTFTDAHTPSSVCTPTRYGLLTGRYAWRTFLQKIVVKGGTSLISDQITTVADMMRSKNYHTSIIGKWHLGMLFDGAYNETRGEGGPQVGQVITEGPIDKGGFDVFRGFHFARQMDLWLEGDLSDNTNGTAGTTGYTTVVENGFDAIDMLPRLTQEALEYLDERKVEKDTDPNAKPFFMYVPWNSPHTPVVPTQEWIDKSTALGLNNHAAFVMQTDDAYGKVIDKLKETGFWENTIVICTADNGTAIQGGLRDLFAANHNVSAQFRGAKGDAWEGGHRVPFLVSWPAKIPAGTTSDALISSIDIMATLADIVGYDLADDEGVDSISFANILTGEPSTKEREDVGHHSYLGHFSIRKGKWKLVLSSASGGFTRPSGSTNASNIIKLSQAYQLYDMTVDEGERINQADRYPDRVEELRALLQKQVDQGYTHNRDGATVQPNDCCRLSSDNINFEAPGSLEIKIN